VKPPERRLAVHPVVFTVSATTMLAFVVGTMAYPSRAEGLFTALQDHIATYFGWLYVLAVASFLGFCLWLLFGPHGDVRLGADDERPEFSRLSWLAMLFSAGMGIGVVFFGVAEPILHFMAPRVGEAGTAEAARRAMELTFFHWGPHAWAIYVVLGLALAYFSFRKNLPLAVRSALHPLFGDRIFGTLGNVVDILAVFGTLFGLATSLGFGAMQINAGLRYLFGVPEASGTQVIIIGVVTSAAVASLVLGLDRGIRRLSEVNIALAGLLMIFVFVVGPTLFLLDSFADNVGAYLRSLVPRTFRRDALGDGEWQKAWTLFYWGWWISWAPFVGTFIARISRGRTIREFVAGGLIAPTLVTFVWMTIFGDTALHIELFEGGGIAAAVDESVATAVFALLEHLPLGYAASFVAALVVALFFVTSSDSGSFVVDMLTSGGEPNPPVWQRIFWATTEGAIAAALLLSGGLGALRAAAICTGLPVCVILILVCVGLSRALREEARLKKGPDGSMPPRSGNGPDGADGGRPLALGSPQEAGG
jgi:choline/glycine/proline betaine transport protein